MTVDERLNVYALALPALPRRIRIHGRTLQAIRVSGVDVVVQPCAGATLISEETLREHHTIVLELARRTDALLPARFGSVLDRVQLVSLVSAAADSIHRALEHVRGRVQMTVRIFGDPPVVETTPMVRPSGTEYLRGRRDRANATPREAETVAHAVASLVIDQRIEAGQATLRASLFHLIAAGSEGKYRTAVADTQALLAPLRLTVTGPWPPFAFAPELWP